MKEPKDMQHQAWMFGCACCVRCNQVTNNFLVYAVCPACVDKEEVGSEKPKIITEYDRDLLLVSQAGRALEELALSLNEKIQECAGALSLVARKVNADRTVVKALKAQHGIEEKDSGKD